MCDPDHRQAIPCSDIFHDRWELKRKFRLRSHIPTSDPAGRCVHTARHSGHAGVNLKTSASKTPKLPNAAAAVLLAPILTGADLPLGYRYQLNKIKEAT